MNVCVEIEKGGKEGDKEREKYQKKFDLSFWRLHKIQLTFLKTSNCHAPRYSPGLNWQSNITRKVILVISKPV